MFGDLHQKLEFSEEARIPHWKDSVKKKKKQWKTQNIE